jgi:ornithine decarboxylase
LAATLGALIGALLGAHAAGAAGGAVGGTIGEFVAFYGFVVTRDVRTARSSGNRDTRRVLRDLLVEFGPAEVLDSLAVRPLAMYAGPVVTAQLIAGDLAVGNIALSSLVVGTFLGKVAADVVFYGLAAVVRERRGTATVAAPSGGDPLDLAALDALPYRTPYLLMDLDRVVDAYHHLAHVLPVDAIHYAVKCNPDPRVLAALHGVGCRFEIASYPELAELQKIGVRGADVLFSNPVKPPDHIARARRAGCWRFAADSIDELHKLADHAPGAAVYVRLRAPAVTGSVVASEGKFGVDPDEAHALLLAAGGLGLTAYGLTFHVGSQMLRPEAWAAALDEVAHLAHRLSWSGIRLSMIDIGGGFPARYSAPVPPLGTYATVIDQALDRLPYRPHVVAEPGRALVAEAGVLVTSVIGRARRVGRDWIHADAGAFHGLMESLETGNRLMYPVQDSRRTPRQVCNLTGPTCDSQDTVLFNTALSADLGCGDRVYIGSTGAYSTAYASRFNGFDIPRLHCVGPTDRSRRPPAARKPPPAEAAASGRTPVVAAYGTVAVGQDR